MRILLFAIFIYTCLSTSFPNQMDYFERERTMFNVPIYEKPFNYTEYTTQTIDLFPTNTTRFVDFMRSRTDKLDLAKTTPNKRFFFNDFVVKQTPRIWKFLGWQYQIHYNEEYWFYNNTNSDNVVFFLHGINGMDGLENMYLLNQLKRNASIYFSVYNPSFLLDHYYNRSYSNHIDNIIRFLDEYKHKKHRVAFVGNSYGSIRLTTLCKRIDCSDYNKIILTDPLHINLPYSAIYKHIIYGVFFEHPTSSWRRKIATIHVLGTEKQTAHFENNLNWFEWSIDTQFMNQYKHNLILVIGEKDNLISVDKECHALTRLCKVIYTNTRHGMVLFSRFLDKINLFQ
jgi:hypothetical protein